MLVPAATSSGPVAEAYPHKILLANRDRFRRKGASLRDHLIYKTEVGAGADFLSLTS